MEILYTSADVHRAIKKIFSNPNIRRVAVVAYLGVNAEKYLPNPKNMEVICWPEPGSTSPDAIRNLLKRGAKILFSEGLHSKVYWSERGCIITSANISHRALGSNPQKEVGILIDSAIFDIDRLVEESRPVAITQIMMDRLEVADRRLKKIIGIKPKLSLKKDFIDWCEAPYRKSWKLGWWSESALLPARSAKAKSKADFNVIKPNDFLNITKNQAVPNDWFLCFEIKEEKIKRLEWMYVDFVIAIEKDDKKAYESEYPFQAVQVHKKSHYPAPPFKITPQFSKAFNKAAKEYGISKIENSKTLRISNRLIELIKQHLN